MKAKVFVAQHRKLILFQIYQACLERSTNQRFTGTIKLGHPIRSQVFFNLWLIFNGGIISFTVRLNV